MTTSVPSQPHTRLAPASGAKPPQTATASTPQPGDSYRRTWSGVQTSASVTASGPASASSERSVTPSGPASVVAASLWWTGGWSGPALSAASWVSAGASAATALTAAASSAAGAGAGEPELEEVHAATTTPARTRG